MFNPNRFEDTLKKLKDRKTESKNPRTREESKYHDHSDSVSDASSVSKDSSVIAQPKKTKPELPEMKPKPKKNLIAPTKTEITLSEGITERVDLEQMFIDLKNLVRKKRMYFLQFCEDQEVKRRRLDKQESLAKIGRIQDAKPTPVVKLGHFLIEDVVEVLKRCDYRILDPEKIKKLMITIGCYYPQKGVVYYMKLIRQTTRLKRHLSTTENVFESFRKPKKFENHQDALHHITETMKRLRAKQLERKKKDLAAIEKEYDQLFDVEEIMKDPSKLLQLLREKISSTSRSLNDVFKTFDINGDGRVTFDEFKEAMLQSGVRFNDEILKEVFRRFDSNESGSITYFEFMECIYGGDKAQAFQYYEKAEENLDKIREILRANFKSYEDFLSYLGNKDPKKLLEEEFKTFMLSGAPYYSRLQLADVFRLLDKGAKGFLDVVEIKELWEKPIKLTELKKKEEEEKQKEESEKLRIQAEMEEAFQKAMAEEEQKRTELATLSRQKLMYRLTGNTSIPTINEQDVRQSELLEKFMVEFSSSALLILKTEGKNLRDLFNLFSKESQGYLSADEFTEACRFILNNEADPKFSKTFFNLFVRGFPKK